MARALLLVALVLGLAACGGKDDATAPTTSTSTTAASSDEAVLASWTRTSASRLFWADPETLEPSDGRTATVPFSFFAAERSPDGGLLAVGADDRGTVELVDVARMRALGEIDIAGADWVERLHWARPDLLLASLAGPSYQAAALDPETREVVAVESLEGIVLYSEAAGDSLVFLLAQPDRIGPARLAVFDGSSIRSTELTEIPAGYEQLGETDEGEPDEDFRMRQSVPGLAVDPGGKRALVVPAGNRVAEVDLETLEVRYHDLAEPVSLLGRLRDWLEPAAEAKSSDGPDRNAVWLPSGLVAVSGSQYSTDDKNGLTVTPAGLSLIDPIDWSVRHLSDEANWVTLRGGALLASAWNPETEEQTLEVFDPQGSLRFTLARDAADLSQVSGDRLYATTYSGTQFEIIDLASGETVAEATPRRETALVALD
jgi:hypothetical protein